MQSAFSCVNPSPQTYSATGVPLALISGLVPPTAVAHGSEAGNVAWSSVQPSL